MVYLYMKKIAGYEGNFLTRRISLTPLSFLRNEKSEFEKKTFEFLVILCSLLFTSLSLIPNHETYTYINFEIEFKKIRYVF